MGDDEDELSFLLSTDRRQEPQAAPNTFEAALQAAALFAEDLSAVLRCPRTGRPGLPPGDPERLRLERLHRDACALAADLCPYEPETAAPAPAEPEPTTARVVAVDPADAAEAARRRAARAARKKS